MWTGGDGQGRLEGKWKLLIEPFFIILHPCDRGWSFYEPHVVSLGESPLIQSAECRNLLRRQHRTEHGKRTLIHWNTQSVHAEENFYTELGIEPKTCSYIKRLFWNTRIAFESWPHTLVALGQSNTSAINNYPHRHLLATIKTS